MEALFIKHPIPSIHANLPKRCQLTNRMSEEYRGIPLFSRRVKKQRSNSCVILCSKRSTFQDFQSFAKPSRVLPAAEANTYTKDVSEDMFSSTELDKSDAFYIVELQTSKDFGSCLRDINSSILLCLIDESGDSILQRISAVSWGSPEQREGTVGLESIHFQRGSVDIVTFKGPKLGTIEALWIGLESGSWRLDGVGLTVLQGPQSLSGCIDGIQEDNFDGLQYKFEADNVLLGEGGLPLAEMRPLLVTEFPREDFSTYINSMNPLTSPSDGKLSNEDGMLEYSDLKFSLLLYDLIIVIAGSTGLLTFSSSEKNAISFLVGGIGGFLYLLLLQRSVDGIGLTADGEIGNFAEGFGRFKGTLFILAFILATGIVAVNYGSGGSSTTLTPAELFSGVAGFLTCKIAVVLAAFKPIRRSLKESK